MAGLEPARAFYGPTDFKSVASAISPHRRLRWRKFKRFVHPAKDEFLRRYMAPLTHTYLFADVEFGLPLFSAEHILARFVCPSGKL